MASSDNAGTFMDTDRAKSKRLAAVPPPACEVVPDAEPHGASGSGLAFCPSLNRPHSFNLESVAAMVLTIGAEVGTRLGLMVNMLFPDRVQGVL